MLRVLFVDDETIIRVAISTIINWEENGYRLVGTASDGLQAMQMIEQQHPHIIITDLKMPNMNGLELIHALYTIGYNGKVIVLSNHGEYELVREALKSGAVDYLLKVTLQPKDLLQVLSKTSEQLLQAQQKKEQNVKLTHQLNEKHLEHRNSIWKDLLQEDEQHLPDVLREASLIGLHLIQHSTHLFYVQIDQYEQALTTGKIKNKKLLQFSVANIMKEVISDHRSIELIDLGTGQYVVLLQDTQQNENYIVLKQLASNLIKLIRTYLNLNVSVTISESFNNLMELRRQYTSCHHAAMATFYYGPASIIITAETSFDQILINTRYTQWASQLKKVLEEESDQFPVIIQLIIEEIAAACCDPLQLKQAFLIFLNELDSLMMKWGDMQVEAVHTLEIEDVMSHSFRPLLLDVQSLEMFKLLLQDIMQEANIRLLEAKQRACRKETLQIIDILRKRLHEKITLDMLASAVNLNSSYLCRIFKQDTGKSMFQYMNELKINHAVLLLKQKDIRVKEVAHQVGIDDPFYFNRLFKKMIGLNPSEFRKKNMPKSTNESIKEKIYNDY